MYWFFLLFAFSAVSAALLDDKFDQHQLIGKKVGFYIGSFDPIHLGHQHVVKKALEHVDFVLIYPAPGGDKYKNRTALHFRQKMISDLYQNDERVLFTYWSPKELQEKFTAKAEVIGVIGSDVVTDQLLGPDQEKYDKVFMRGIPFGEKHAVDTIGALMALKADSFLVSVRGDIDFSLLNGMIHDRPIRAFIPSGTLSSTEIKTAIQQNKPFEHNLAFSVQALIKQEGLYGCPHKFKSELQRELLEMQKKDQMARTYWANRNKWEEIEKLDAHHTPKLKAIIKQYGWPGVSLVGLEGTSAMWLLVQHQDHAQDFQKECLGLLEKAVAAYESPKKNYAYLLDRVRMHENQPQVYGTQWLMDRGKCTLYKVEDRKNLNARRLEAGLCTIEEYKEQMKTFYHLKDEDLYED